MFGLGGFALLVALGVWQMQRLDWKNGLLAEIEARIAADPIPLPPAPASEADRYLPVAVEGQPAGAPIHVLVSRKGYGAGYRVIAPLATPDGRRIMVDLGIIGTDAKDAPLPMGPYAVTGNLHWPEEVDGFTPDPDMKRNIWLARDVPAMARALQAEPFLIVARTLSPAIGPEPYPVGTAGIPNNHLGYAIQWFGLAAVWLGMTLFLLWRIRRRTI
nr:SURF1 family protein [Jannaschia sp. S6380]